MNSSIPSYEYEYISKPNSNKNVYYKQLLNTGKLKCWFCNEQTKTIIGICDFCKNEKIPHIC